MWGASCCACSASIAAWSCCWAMALAQVRAAANARILMCMGSLDGRVNTNCSGSVFVEQDRLVAFSRHAAGGKRGPATMHHHLMAVVTKLSALAAGQALAGELFQGRRQADAEQPG